MLGREMQLPQETWLIVVSNADAKLPTPKHRYLSTWA